MSTLAQPASSPLAALGDRSCDDHPPDAALFEYFVTARRRARGPMLVVSSDWMFRNAAAAAVIGPGDHPTLWAWASHAIRAGDPSVHALHLRDLSLSAQCQTITAGADVVGAFVRLRTHAPTANEGSPRPSRRRSDWERLRESELGIAQHVAAGMTNREIGARLFMSRHTVDFHLRQIFRKLGINSRVELTRFVVENRAQGYSGYPEELRGTGRAHNW